MESDSPSRSTDAADRPRLNIRDVARAGRLYSLAVDRFPGMPLFPGHPPFQVLTYRSPQGLRISGARPWGPGNDAGLGYMCEYVSSTSHSGAHIDALAHMTIGDDDHWFCGATRTHFGGFWPDRRRRDRHSAHLDARRALRRSAPPGRRPPRSGRGSVGP